MQNRHVLLDKQQQFAALEKEEHVLMGAKASHDATVSRYVTHARSLDLCEAPVMTDTLLTSDMASLLFLMQQQWRTERIVHRTALEHLQHLQQRTKAAVKSTNRASMILRLDMQDVPSPPDSDSEVSLLYMISP